MVNVADPPLDAFELVCRAHGLDLHERLRLFGYLTEKGAGIKSPQNVLERITAKWLTSSSPVATDSPPRRPGRL